MFLFEESMDSFDKKFQILIGNSDLAISKIQNEFDTCYTLNSLYSEATTEPNGTQKTSLFGYIGKFVGKIIQIITDFVKMIGDIFNVKDNLTAEQYYRSDALNDKFNSDYQAIEYTVRKELAEGNRLIQKISSVTGIDDAEIQKYVSRASGAIKKAIPAAVTAGTAWGIRKLLKKSSDEDKASIEKAKQSAEKIAAGDDKKQKQVMTVLSTMNQLVKTKITSAKNLCNEIRKREKPSGTNNNKNDNPVNTGNNDEQNG